MSDPLPTFRTSRLVVRPRTMADLDACMALDRDPEVTRFIPGPWTEPETHRAFIEKRIRHSYPLGMGYWAVLAQEEFVGWILLTPLNLHGPEIEIGWRFTRRVWDRGYATEAAQPVLAHALETLRLPEVVADIDPCNRASIRVAQKLGMKAAGDVPYAGRIVTRYIATPTRQPA